MKHPEVKYDVVLVSCNAAMHEYADRLAGGLVGVEPELEREFEARLVESSTLTFRVAFAVLRHRQDAEDVSQEAFVKAYRNFRQLRERDRFRAWLVRMTWRLAIDRQRAERRRAVREMDHGAPVALPTTAETLAARERTAQLWQAIDALPGKLRVVTIDCSATGLDDGRFKLDINIEDSSVADVPSVENVPKVFSDIPAFRGFNLSASLVLKDGQTSEFVAATDKITGEVTKIDVTLTAIK